MEPNLTKKKSISSLWISTGLFNWVLQIVAFFLAIALLVGAVCLVYKIGLLICANIFGANFTDTAGKYFIGFVVGAIAVFLLGVVLVVAFSIIFAIVMYILDLILAKKILDKVQYLPLTKEELDRLNIPDISLLDSLDNLSNYMKNLFSFREDIKHTFFYTCSMKDMLSKSFLETYEAFAKSYPDIVKEDKEFALTYAKNHSKRLVNYIIYKDENRIDKETQPPY